MEVKIKNITIEVDGQDFSFTHRSIVENTVYDPAKDPEVQGKGLEDVAPVAPVEQPETGTETPAPTEESAPVDSTPAVEPLEVVPTE